MTMKKTLSATASLFLSVMMIFSFSVMISAKTHSSEKVYIQDESGYLSESEMNNIVDMASSYSEKTGYNIALVISDDIEGKSAESYSDDIYDDIFGINTDGVLVLLNNDTFIDHISTSGDAILMYDDYRIESVHEYAHSSLKKGNYSQALSEYIDYLGVYYDSGIPNSNEGYYVNTETSTLEREFPFMQVVIFGFFGFAIVFGLTVLIVWRKYRFKSAPSAKNYIDWKDTFFRQKEDFFVRQYTTSYHIDSSSGGHSGGGSSTHRSSSGGTHGGGSHRR